MGVLLGLVGSCFELLLYILHAMLGSRSVSRQLEPKPLAVRASMPGHLTFSESSILEQDSPQHEKSVSSTSYGSSNATVCTPPPPALAFSPSLPDQMHDAYDAQLKAVKDLQNDPKFAPSSSFTLPPPSTDVPALLSISLPSPISADSAFFTPARVPDSGPSGHTELYTPTRPRTVNTTDAMLSDRSDGGDGGSVLVGLGIEFLYKDPGKRFDGLGILPRRGSDSVVEWDAPSRIFLEEIYHTFASPSPSGKARASATPSPPFRFESVSFGEEDEDDIFRVAGWKTPHAGPVAVSTPRRGRRVTAKGILRRGRLDYVRATVASKARCMKVEEGEEGNESFVSSGSSSGSSSTKPEWKY